MQFSMLASGSQGNCCIVESKETKLMIDCGTTKRYLFEAMGQIGVMPQDLTALLLTHSHSDHISQLKQLKDVVTFATFEKPDFNIHPISTHVTFKIENISVTSIPLSHDVEKTVGYVLDDGDERLVYLTDTGYLNERYMSELMNADYYVMESNHDPQLLMKTNRPYMTKQRILSSEGHLSNEACANYLCELIGEKTKEIVLAHLSHEANTSELAIETTRKALIERRFNLDRLRIRTAKQFEVLVGGGVLIYD